MLYLIIACVGIVGSALALSVMVALVHLDLPLQADA